MAAYLNNDILMKAYRKAGIVDETLPPSATQLANGLDLMNDYLSMRATDGLYLGYYPQTSGTAASPLRSEFYYGVILLLANQLASDCGQPIEDPTLVAEIAKADDILRKAIRRTIVSDLSELPRAQAGPQGGLNWS